MNFYKLYDLIVENIEVKLFDGLPKNWKSLITIEEFPFLYKQFEKSPSLINDKFKLYLEGGKVVAYISYDENSSFGEKFPFKTTHLVDLEVAISKRGQGLFKKLMNDLPKSNMTLQANTDELIKTYEKYGFHLYGNPEETGNFMINFNYD